MRIPAPITAAILALAVTGCGGTPATTSTPTITPEPVTSAPAAPASTAPAGIGAKRESSDDKSKVTVAVYHFRRLTLASPDIGKRGYVYFGADVKLCVVENTDAPISVSPGPWSVSFADDTSVAALFLSDGWFDLPLYPQDRVVPVGRCVRGWIPFEVPKDSKPKTLLYVPSTSPLEWAIK
jgi:hypothetical protein